MFSVLQVMLYNLNKCFLLLFKNNAVFHSSVRERFGIGELIIFVLMVEIPCGSCCLFQTEVYQSVVPNQNK